MNWERRQFMKRVSATSIATTAGISRLGGRALAIPANGDEFPRTDVDTSQITRDEFGIDYQYTTSVGAHLDLLDSGVWLDETDVWQFTYHTSASCSNNKKQVGSGGDGFKTDLFDGDHVIEITELDAPDQVSTGYFGNADWGLGMTEDVDHSYSWADATVDTIWAIVNHFGPLVSSVTTADDIHSYWKKASQDGEQSDGIRHEWNRYALKKTSGHFMRFFVAFPPAEDMSVDYVDMWVNNKIRNTLFENNGDNVPTNDYSMTWGLTHAVLSRPSSMSTAEKQEYGITKKRAKDVAGLTDLRSVDPEETVYVAERPPVKVRKVE